ncbi:hypothetical protein OB955_20985 [Halobacteria archaeon AArc-m2/3/4]|uniref:Uncharacterized protein n=1 Tax=Natronoglomus mannanivorans TaxID=2979990 RepID=A0ABT2QJS0_9EURY|nr:hypothetical protein [Halobacteria archaeon AArc-m2/3/4]
MGSLGTLSRAFLAALVVLSFFLLEREDFHVHWCNAPSLAWITVISV